jgi:hypothetical protein
MAVRAMNPRLFAPSIVLVDVDAHLPAAEVVRAAAALQRQVLEHFAPAWGVMASVRAASAEHPARPEEWHVEFRAVPTLEGALGNHDESDDGVPRLYVFPALCIADGTTWTSCASHEILEALADPYLRRCVQADDGSIWDAEVCDRVEADTYLIDGVAVSNFSTPACFEPPKKRDGVAYDFLGLSTRPNEVRPGGYAQRFDPTHGWTQVGKLRSYRAKLHELGLSRGRRRVMRGRA